ncbi:LLM class flavin-dependent oxidoreductase [Nakamurella sp. YIM 132087]|uniref:LLM class flavin-dependent oxidoreductase n=1 Tax=Nakamurella alba TaxID=2665158 RepID=A0A7K1FID5_9ACTN|nr:LLM class flavin-dependent oxidoreductase [Nakamurella alba]MTD13881.1 LLM class flavin-dependent oxidoreductase [Nakamurella alba]
MPDYHRPLSFGTFLTPVNDPPSQPVDLARRSEEWGYDLVTFQDHPYQPTFHDTWTLLCWVAARTTTIQLSANVLNLPLRLPAVAARAAASLDLLSGGRVQLGLGSGAFWDAIEAMGGRRLTPAEAVTSLEEAIGIIRGVWDPAERRPLRVAGTVYSVDGAKRGPAPAHDIPIHIGAYKPRMLRLVGRSADGWLPSLPYLQPGDLEKGNRTIDDAAVAAGRDPREIRRLLNVMGQFGSARAADKILTGPPATWVEDLLPLAVEQGVDTFVLGSDDPYSLQMFAEEVAPALREAVAEHRGPGAADLAPVRSAEVRARRRPGIDYEAVPARLTAIEPGDARFGRVRNTYMRGGSPGLVLQAGSVQDVVTALEFARRQQVPLAVRSGGHGISGRSTNDGGIVIDLAGMNEITVLDEARRIVRLGPGARWGEVAAALDPYGWALSSGDYGGVGVGGLATAGGIGWLARQHGLTVDHLRAVEIVLSDGTLVRADAEHEPDLFWAVRGAGANFGIVTAFEFEVDEVGDVGWAQLAIRVDDIADYLVRFGAVMEAAPRDLTCFLIMGATRPGRPQVAQLMAMVDCDDPDTIISRLQPLADTGPLLDQSVSLTRYASVMNNASPAAHNGQGDPVARSGLIDHLTPAFTSGIAGLLDAGTSYFFQIRCVGGAVGDVDPAATAYGNRSANFSVIAFGGDRARLDDRWDALHPHFSGLYPSFDTDLREARLDDAFPPATIARLRDLKRRYDPDNVFRDNFNIRPEQAVTG